MQIRRGLSVDLAAIGRLDPDAIAAVHAEITPQPESSDDLHDLLCSLVLMPPRPEWQALWEELVASGRAGTIDCGGRDRWCATELLADVERLETPAGDDVAVAIVRGHLELAGITTISALGRARTAAEPGRDRARGPRARGLRAAGQLHPRRRRRAVGVAPAAPRMHSYSRKRRRSGVEPATAQDFMRFLLRWQHLAPGTQLAGVEGLAKVISGLQGWEAAAAAWEPELIGRRLRGYNDAALDRLCHEGEIGWLRLTPKPRDINAPAGAPNKATPISVVFRADLGWLLDAARDRADPEEPITGATAEVIEHLRAHGACFATELGHATGRLREDIERGLWDGVSRGLLTADGFGAIRARVDRRAQPEPPRLSRLSRGGRPRPTAAGRWALVPTAPPEGATDRDELAEAVAELLLNRWGVIFRDLAMRESIRFPWREVQHALRRLEDRGLVQGGRFVSGFSGEQFALPAAAEQLAHVKKLPRTGERVTVNATDPCNLVATIVPGAVVPAIRTRRITYVDGVPD